MSCGVHASAPVAVAVGQSAVLSLELVATPHTEGVWFSVFNFALANFEEQ